jgi:hypothetical protein
VRTTLRRWGLNCVRQKKGKGKIVLMFNEALWYEDVWGSGGIDPPFLTSALGGGEWSSLPPEKGLPVPIG